MIVRQTARNARGFRDTPEADLRLPYSFPPRFPSGPSAVRKSIQNPCKSNHFYKSQFTTDSARTTYNFSALTWADSPVHPARNHTLSPHSDRRSLSFAPLALCVFALNPSLKLNKPERFRTELQEGYCTSPFFAPSRPRCSFRHGKMGNFEYVLSTKRGGWGYHFPLSSVARTKMNKISTKMNTCGGGGVHCFPLLILIVILLEGPSPFPHVRRKIVKIGELADFRPIRPRRIRHLQQIKNRRTPILPRPMAEY
jgi:hypothetical protein